MVLSRLGARRGFDGVLLVLFALALILANRAAIDSRNVEYGDFAANSLLIQTAKAGHLLVGNYSRVGFNHPGPAILDVLAAGEALFFDLLHCVPSPFSGQLVAVALYNAFWMVLIVRLWRRLTENAVAAIGGGLVFFIATALLDVRFYSGPWFPHLYFFPFATFLLAAAGWGLGRSDSIQSLAVSLGFLINGHVAFGAITAIAIATVLAANWIEFRKSDESRVVLWPSWWTAHRRALLLGSLTVAIFLVPLAIETVRQFPGPVAEYLRFGSGHGRNTPKASLRFVAMYWGGLPFITLPAAFIVVAYRCRFEDAALARTVHSLLAGMMGSSIAIFLYAFFGVDMLYSAYIGYFYCSLPALVVALGATIFFRSTTSKRHEQLVALLAVIIFFIACVKLPRESDYTALYRAPALEDLYKSLAEIPHEGRLVIDLEPDPSFTATWPVVAGIELVAIRRGDDLLCVGKRWHILFTKHARCTAGEVEQGTHVVVRNTSEVNPSGHPAIAEGMGASFFASDPASTLAR